MSTVCIADPVERRPFDVARIRSDFQTLAQKIHGHPLVYLDNGASALKPRQVIDTMRDFYARDYANVHRGVHTLSQRATDAFEAAREKAGRFINAEHLREVVFVRGTTEGINLVASGFARQELNYGDEVLITEMEHHSNIVPWQLACEQAGAKLRVAPILESGEVDIEAFERMLGPKTKIAAFAHVSNALGTVNPVKRMIEAAKAVGAATLLDGAQAVPHVPVDVQALGCDFYAFSSHKLYGPTGIGILYGKREWLLRLPPYQGGGDMIRAVTFDKTWYNDLPYKFEAGTPAIAEAVGFGAAIDYVQSIGLDAIARHEHELLDYAMARAAEIPELRVVGTAPEKAAILSFLLDGVHAHDIGTILDRHGVAIRAGHHCAMPVMEHFHVAATARASFGLYNTHEDVDALFAAVRKTLEMFRG